MSGSGRFEVENAANSSGAAEGKPTGKARFKVIGHVVRALKRWQNALNPTYSYGSGKPDPNAPRLPYAMSMPRGTLSVPNAGSATLTRTGSGRTLSGRPDSSGTHYGHKGSLLFKSLPEDKPKSAA